MPQRVGLVSEFLHIEFVKLLDVFGVGDLDAIFLKLIGYRPRSS